MQCYIILTNDVSRICEGLPAYASVLTGYEDKAVKKWIIIRSGKMKHVFLG